MESNNRKKIIKKVLIIAAVLCIIWFIILLANFNQTKYNIEVAVKDVGNFFSGEKTESDFKYVINGNGTCKVTGYAGEIDYELNYIARDGDGLNIPEKISGLTVTEIGNLAFSQRDVRYIPNGFETITPSFVGPLTIPDSVTTIGYKTFYNGKGFNSVVIPEHVVKIENEAFSGCLKLPWAEFLGDAPTEFGSNVFYGCGCDYESVGTFKILYDPTKSGWSTPEWNGYPAYPKSLWGVENGFEYLDNNDGTCTIIGYWGNEHDRYSEETHDFIIPKEINGLAVTVIGEKAFLRCYGIKGDLIIPDSVTTIERLAFWECYGITSVTIPESVTGIAYGAFIDCNSLSEVEFLGDAPARFGYNANNGWEDYVFKNPPGVDPTIIYDPARSGWSTPEWRGYACYPKSSLKSENNFKYSDNGDGTCTIVKYTGADNSHIEIPKEINGLAVTAIGIRAFQSCTNLKSVIIPENVTKIYEWAFNKLNEAEFLGDAPIEVGEFAFGYYGEDICKIIYDPAKSGWSSPPLFLNSKNKLVLYHGYPCYPKSS